MYPHPGPDSERDVGRLLLLSLSTATTSAVLEFVCHASMKNAAQYLLILHLDVYTGGTGV